LSTLGINLNLSDVKKEAAAKQAQQNDENGIIATPAAAILTLFERYKSVLKVDSVDDFLDEFRELKVAQQVKIFCKGANSKKDRENLEILLGRAISQQKIEIVSILLDSGINANNNAWSASLLWEAVGHGNVELVKMLLLHGANVNAVVQKNVTPLMTSVILEDPLITYLLLQKKARIEMVDVFGETAVSCAVKASKCFLVEDLLREAKRTGVDAGLEVVNRVGNTPFMECTQTFAVSKDQPHQRQVNFAKLYLTQLRPLFKYGVNVNVQGPGKRTALMFAVIYEQFDLAALLLSHGADPCIPEDRGYTPLSWTQVKQQSRMRDLLLAHEQKAKSTIFAKVDEQTEHKRDHQEDQQAGKVQQLATTT
jgi:ankyrin repeat protein